MAKTIIGVTRMRLAGNAADGPLVVRSLHRQGVNVTAFCNAFNAATARSVGLLIQVVVTLYADRSFAFVVKATLAPRAASAVRWPAVAA